VRFRSTRPLRAVAPLLVVVALCACAPSRTIVTGPEADRAERFFAGLPGRVVFPVKASFSGTAVPVAGDAVPFLAGISAPSAEEEMVGLYDPLGRGVAFFSNDGRRVVISRGPAAELAGFRGAAPLDAGPVSLARILSGVPGYAVAAAEAARCEDGSWSLSDGRQTLRSDPGRPRRKLVPPWARVRAVDRLRAWGSTAFYDAVLQGLDLVERHRGRRALVLFTDGEDMVSHATAEDVERRIEVSATPVYVIAQGKGMRDAALKRVLDRVAGVSGGRAFYTDRIEQLEGVFAEIGEDLASQYLLAYTPGTLVRDGSWRTIRVEVPGKGKQYEVRARQGYRASPRGR